MSRQVSSPQRFTITEGDTAPYRITYRYQTDDPSAASVAELVAWSMRTRDEVMRSPATVTPGAVEADGTFRGDIEAAASYLEPGVYHMQIVLTMPDASLWRLPMRPHQLFVATGPGDAVVPSAPADSDLSFTFSATAHGRVRFDPVRLQDDGTVLLATTADPFPAEYVVVEVPDDDTLILQDAGAVTITGGHGLALGAWYLAGSGAPQIQQPKPTAGAVQKILHAVTGEVALITIGEKAGF